MRTTFDSVAVDFLAARRGGAPPPPEAFIAAPRSITRPLLPPASLGGLDRRLTLHHQTAHRRHVRGGRPEAVALEPELARAGGVSHVEDRRTEVVAENAAAVETIHEALEIVILRRHGPQCSCC